MKTVIPIPVTVNYNLPVITEKNKCNLIKIITNLNIM